MLLVLLSCMVAFPWRRPGVSKQDAQVALKGTSSGDKNELLFSRFGINYNDLPQRFRKGTTLYRARPGGGVAPGHASMGAATGPERVKGSITGGGRDEGSTGQGRAEGPVGAESVALSRGAAHNLAERGSASSEETLVAGDGEAGGVNNPALGSAEEGPERGDRISNSAARGKGEMRPASQRAGGETSSSPAGAAGEALQGAGSKQAPRVEREGEAGRRGGVSGGVDGQRRSAKKGHPPPGALEEAVCDIIRDDFWVSNEHILAGVERRR